MAKTPDKKVYKELKKLGEIPKYETERTSAVFSFRVIEADTDPKERLDIREYMTSDRFTGFTARGISISKEQIEPFIEMLQKASEYFKGKKKGGKK